MNTPLQIQANELFRAGRLAEAAALYRRVLAGMPDDPEALFHLGQALRAQGSAPEALACFDRLVRLHPDQPGALFHRGNALLDTGDFARALADYESALGLRPGHADGWLHRGNALAALGRADEALASFDRALALAPDRADIWYNRATLLQSLGRHDDALAAYDHALSLAPDLAAAWNNRGSLLHRMGRADEALQSYDRAIAADPHEHRALVNRGVIEAEQRRFQAALESYDRALAIAPGVADAWHNRGNLLREMRRLDDALASFSRALELEPRHAEALCSRAGVLQIDKQFDAALADWRRLAASAPGHKYLLGGVMISARELCDWQTLEALRPRFEAEVASGRSIVPPFVALGCCDDPALAQAAARHYLRDLLPALPAHARPKPERGAKIRLAYVSGDFHNHATSRLMVGLFERHDRSRFEVTGVSIGPDEDSDIRKRLVAAFDRFEDVRHLSDAEAAARLRALNIDIAIDLKGYTEGFRIGIFAHRAAPVQVNYLGYPGTLGAGFIDHVLADAIVLPPGQQTFYDENIVHLPHCYQPGDPARSLPAAPSRMQAGLPETGFVFCCFNNHWKITRPLFEIWLRLLAATPGSVLWLMEGAGRPALCRQAQAHGIDPARLIFAPLLEQAPHMARHRLADLVLDTLPYNAHTTGSDALWAGVPLVTVMGRAFAGRVGASLLSAAGLPELIAPDLAAYEALALALAREPGRLAALRAKLDAARHGAPLFDAAGFARDIEAAYERMLASAAARD